MYGNMRWWVNIGAGGGLEEKGASRKLIELTSIITVTPNAFECLEQLCFVNFTIISNICMGMVFKIVKASGHYW